MSVNSRKNYAIVTHEAVNFSTAKQKFSFSKNTRFSLPLAEINKKGEFNYTLPTTLTSRRASFGVGDRFKTPLETGFCKLSS
jgi:hypothetical protein